MFDKDKTRVIFWATVVLIIITGAIIGTIIAALLGFSLLALAIKVTHGSGDEATGLSGLVIPLLPIGFIVGARIGVKLSGKLPGTKGNKVRHY